MAGQKVKVMHRNTWHCGQRWWHLVDSWVGEKRIQHPCEIKISWCFSDRKFIREYHHGCCHRVLGPLFPNSTTCITFSFRPPAVECTLLVQTFKELPPPVGTLKVTWHSRDLCPVPFEKNVTLAGISMILWLSFLQVWRSIRISGKISEIRKKNYIDLKGYATLISTHMIFFFSFLT